MKKLKFGELTIWCSSGYDKAKTASMRDWGFRDCRTVSGAV